MITWHPIATAQLVHAKPVLVKGGGIMAWAVWINQPTPASDDAGRWYYCTPFGERSSPLDFTPTKVKP